MHLTNAQHALLAHLKNALQRLTPKDFERLVARLIEVRIGVRISVARSGFQHGADAGTAGRAGRRLRIEAKRYADETALNERELLGEIDHALARDPGLECWVLAATRRIDEQLDNSLRRKGEETGLPILTLGWEDDVVGSLATLCAGAPDIVTEIDAAAGSAAAALADIAGAQLDRLERELTEWQLGFETLRMATQLQVKRIWTSKRAALSHMQQNVAGGETPHFVARISVSEALTSWWAEGGDSPAAIVGSEGVGKTWAAFSWLVNALDTQPLVLVLPASAFGPANHLGRSELIALFARQLQSITDAHDVAHWMARLGRLLKRPPEEGPVLTLVLDGVNQRPSISWLGVMRMLQDEPFAGRVRVILTNRPSYFDSDLRSLSKEAIYSAARRIDLAGYDDRELDSMLASHGVARTDLSPDLLALARTPRLLDLVVALREEFRDAGPVTVHRLLYEYGRKTLGPRDEGVLEPEDWRGWLQTLADAQRKKLGVTRLDLEKLLARPTRHPEEVRHYLSIIVDGPFARTDVKGEVAFAEPLVSHALATALIDSVMREGKSGPDAIAVVLDDWLDPISKSNSKLVG